MCTTIVRLLYGDLRSVNIDRMIDLTKIPTTREEKLEADYWQARFQQEAALEASDLTMAQLFSRQQWKISNG